MQLYEKKHGCFIVCWIHLMSLWAETRDVYTVPFRTILISLNERCFGQIFKFANSKLDIVSAEKNFLAGKNVPLFTTYPICGVSLDLDGLTVSVSCWNKNEPRKYYWWIFYSGHHTVFFQQWGGTLRFWANGEFYVHTPRSVIYTILLVILWTTETVGSLLLIWTCGITALNRNESAHTLRSLISSSIILTHSWFLNKKPFTYVKYFLSSYSGSLRYRSLANGLMF